MAGFFFKHQRLLNTIESWFLLLGHVDDQVFVAQQHDNIVELVRHYLGFSGTREIWDETRHMFAPGVRELVDATLA